ncbi:cupredoxin domain-containing protein [Mycoplana dimorpha]|uniref:Plastocyanin n=1 Tax=Mycoplana dimorpha TaxID=28320 RepID=A0A2T5B8G7_MYCDI|nr:cupredoxin family copper-binding protein [Mycoplana dimorpha]PTM95282.1 plastocyanin [Mycoplana dimorpha]
MNKQPSKIIPGMLQKALRMGLGTTLIALLALPIAPAGATETQVTISNFTFKPQALTISRGDTVRFVNSDDMVHTIVAGDGSFRSGALDTDDSFVWTFSQPGTIAYFCGLHPFMKGSIVVK